jgi:hypothetical protein
MHNVTDCENPPWIINPRILFIMKKAMLEKIMTLNKRSPNQNT